MPKLASAIGLTDTESVVGGEICKAAREETAD